MCSVAAGPQLIAPWAAAGASAALALGAGAAKIPVARGHAEVQHPSPAAGWSMQAVLLCKHCVLFEIGQDMISKSNLNPW